MSPSPGPQPQADPVQLLNSMYRNEPQLGSDGQLHEIDRVTRIPPEEGELLVRLHRELAPLRTVEIGLGYGFSTLFFMIAMRESGRGHHVAIDPMQQATYHGIGLARVALLGMQDRFTFIGQESATGLPRLADLGVEAQLIFIDGQHRFDNALVDFFLSDAICALGGVIVFDDLWMPALQKVARFIAANRDDYQRIETPVANVAVFRKIGRDQRPWHHYQDF